MSWFKGPYPSRTEMRRELKAYLDAAHKTKKHITGTQQLLKSLWKKAHSRPFDDVWPQLHATALGAINANSIKYAFRSKILLLQENRCCYCRRWLVNTAYAKPIEHILPRRHYPQFSIEFWNMAVSCYDCNSAKKDEVWGTTSKTVRRYPKAQEFTEVFHPRFHRYDEHVRYVRVETNSSMVVLFAGLTPQGKHLCRSLLHLIAAKESLIKNNPVLKSAISEIRSFEAKAEGLNLTRLDAFRAALDRSMLRSLE
jgi:uncharacterized protein (TIGR02646 family)